MIAKVHNLEYNIEHNTFNQSVDWNDLGRYLKGVFKNQERFTERFLKPLKDYVIAYNRPDRIESLNLLNHYFAKATPYSYEEAFKLTNKVFQALVFGSINITEMLEKLGSNRLGASGVELKQRVYSEDGSYKIEPYTAIYELYSIDCSNLGASETGFVVKCWCTTTQKEHWIWVEKEYATDPLTAIASTCRVYENMIGHIAAIKRQGDVFLFEMTDDIIPNGPIIPLTAKQYFGLLVSQT
jgi:hypothetical protein